MEDLTLPSVGGSFKKWVYYASILPKPPGPCYMQGLEKSFFFFKQKNFKNKFGGPIA
jgi:hypothetical protein